MNFSQMSLDLQACFFAGLFQGDRAIRTGAVLLANGHEMEGAGLGHDAGLADIGCDTDHTGQDLVRSEGAAQDIDGLNPVLQGYHRGIRPDDGTAGFGNGFGVLQFDGEQQVIRRRQRGDVIGHLGRVDQQVTFRPGDAQPFFPDRVQMRAARDKGNVLTRKGQPTAEIAANTAGTKCNNIHVSNLAQVREAQARWIRWQASSSTSVARA